MKMILAIFLFAVLASHSAFADQVPRCEPPSCNPADPGLRRQSGEHEFGHIQCAPVNGWKGEVVANKGCGECVRTECDKARAMADTNLMPVEGAPVEQNKKPAKGAKEAE